jgi:FkbM family methyltransferase
MQFMSKLLDAFTSTPSGRIAYKPIQKLIHLSRRLAHPDLPLDHELIYVSYRQRRLPIEVHRWSISDRQAVEQCFTEAQYDMPSGAHGVLMERIYSEIVASGKKPLIIDCGANIGASVLWFNARYPEAHIVAIEPAPDNFALLRKNCKGLDVDFREAGVDANDGHASLSSRRGTGMGYQTNTENDGIAIKLISLRTVIESKPTTEYTPFLLKIDIEGAEKSLFSGDTATVNQFPLIILEPHDWMLPGQRSSVEFFRFHASAGREFSMKHENVASIAYNPALLEN